MRFQQSMTHRRWLPLVVTLAALMISACDGDDGAPPPTRTAAAERTPPVATETVGAASPTTAAAATVTGVAPSATAAATSGIAGIVLIGPTCPVVREGEDCDDRPYEADIDVKNASGAVIGRVRSSADGTFFIALPPGRYMLVPLSPGVLPTASPLDVEVTVGAVAEVTVSYDSGIR